MVLYNYWKNQLHMQSVSYFRHWLELDLNKNKKKKELIIIGIYIRKQKQIFIKKEQFLVIKKKNIN